MFRASSPGKSQPIFYLNQQTAVNMTMLSVQAAGNIPRVPFDLNHSRREEIITYAVSDKLPPSITFNFLDYSNNDIILCYKKIKDVTNEDYTPTTTFYSVYNTLIERKLDDKSLNQYAIDTIMNNLIKDESFPPENLLFLGEKNINIILSALKTEMERRYSFNNFFLK
ncbi:hypothetical protein [Candidatus Regiella insecticola]|uniref:Uncharacterized protein n=1 Tax=Candidatus Regiella insecticola TaxID=138073 RepID=A0A6L2ZRN0_9ENTR|nr:hypothetical protein [Candidatus Regiella insecticola]GFN47222.1 hypothetical protein RINTU1_31840 [Candidatus Regiella insecticola]